ncbi:MAG: phage tail protein [Planctomycetaceae bacterium]|nr:phage tail protein [Planctomycetaceae bacterium]
MSNLGATLFRTGAMIVGSYFGGPIGAIAAYAVASAIYPMKFEGERPEFSDYPLQSSTKGQPVPIVFGTKELAGNIIWLGPSQPYHVKHETGGKGGGDTSTSYEARYRRSFLIAICEGPATIGRCFKGKDEISLTEFTSFSGDGNVGLADLIGDDWTDYKNVCCAWFEDYELGNSPAIPNFVFEVGSTPTGIFSVTAEEGNIRMIYGSGTSVSPGPAVDLEASAVPGYRRVGIPIVGAPFKVGQYLCIGGPGHAYTLSYGYPIEEITASHVIIRKSAFSVATFTGQEYAHASWRITDADTQAHPIIVGKYMYIAGQFPSGHPQLTRINLQTGVRDANFFEIPNPVPTAVALAMAITKDKTHLIVAAEHWLYKYRISDGALVWKFLPGGARSPAYQIAVDSHGRIYRGAVRPDPYFSISYYRISRITASGDAIDLVYDVRVPFTTYAELPGTLGLALWEDFENPVTGEKGLMAGSQTQYTGASMFSYPLALWTMEGRLLDWWAPSETSADNGFAINDVFWHRGYLYAWGYHATYNNGGPCRIWKFSVLEDFEKTGEAALKLEQVAHVPYGACFWPGPDGNIWAAKNSYPSIPINDDTLYIYDWRDLSLVHTRKIGKLAYITGSNLNRHEYATNVAFSSDAHDEYPPDIIKALLTDQRKGIGLPLTLLNLGTFDEARAYCEEQNIKMSVALTRQQPIADWLQYICSHFMGFLYESNGKICIGSMLRQVDAVATITQDDLVRESEEPPVRITPRQYSETFNRVESVWSDRQNRYRETPVPAFDEVDQRVSGLLRHKVVDIKGFHDPDLAARMAWLNFINVMYRFKTYSFKVGFKHLGLEVGDRVTLSDGHLVTNQKVLITKIDLSMHGKHIQIEAVEDIASLYPTLAYTTQRSLRQPDPAVTLTNGTVAFRESTQEAKLLLSITPGGAQTNGWYIYRSYDNISYDLVGRCTIDQVTGGAANSSGTLQSRLPAYTAVMHRKDEGFNVSIGTVTDLDTAVTDEAFFNNRKLARVGSEIIAYRDCVETATAGTWRLSNLIRGLFGTIPAAHAAGEVFQTLDTDFTYTLTEGDIGKTLYFKVISFYGSKVQSVSAVSASSVKVQGLWQRPFAASLVRLQQAESDIAPAVYTGGSFTLYWNRPGARGTGFNQGGFDLNPDYPLWRWGDPESELTGGDGAAFGHYLADGELQAVDLVFETAAGVQIGQRSVAADADSAVISKADDLNNNSQAVIKVYPRRSYRAAAAAALRVTGE